MNIKITNKDGATLKTANKYVKEDIAIVLDESFAQPSGTLKITENGTHDVTNYESVNVNVASSGSGTDMLQARVDATNSCEYLFYRYTGSNVDFISNLETSNVTDMGSMFYNCSNLTTIPQLDTSNITDMASMFSGCSSLTSVSLTNTSKVTNIYGMFSSCVSLTSVPQLNIRNVTNMNNTFKGCSALETIDITYYNLSSNVSNFASNCTALKSLIIRSFGTNYVLSSNAFNNSGIASGTGYIYVPRNMVDTLKSATNWSTYASQIRALEDYTVDGTTTGALDETKI